MVVIFKEAGRPPAGSPPKQGRRWSDLALWLPSDGRLSSIWETLPFRRTTAGAAQTGRSSAIHPYHHQTSGSEEPLWAEHAKDDKDPATSSNKAHIRCLKSDVAGQGAAAASNGSSAVKGGGVAVGLQDVVMDAKIWNSLPEDIIEKVLAWLPLTSVIRFRAVCRQWNSVLLSGSFLSSHSKISLHRRPCFLLCTIGQFACIYDPSLGKWLTLLKPTSPGASVVASTGSLLCLGNQVTECRVLSVCNPITSTLRHLPAMRNLRLIHKITMLEDQNTSSYTILVAGEDNLPMPNRHNFDLITEVFNSRVNAWHAASSPPPNANFGSDPGAWLDGAFYCLTELPYGVVKFSLEKGIWEEVAVAMPPSLSVASLVTVRNRLMMVGRCKTYSQTEVAITILVWELVQRPVKMSKGETASIQEQDEDGVVLNSKENSDEVYCAEDQYEWMEVVKMPKSVSEEFLAPLFSYSPFVCVGVGSSICITTHLSPRVLVLDCSLASTSVAGDCWSWLPQDPLFPIHRDFHLLGFSFEPRFDACP